MHPTMLSVYKMDQKGMQRESSGALAATFVVDGRDSAFPGEHFDSGPIEKTDRKPSHHLYKMQSLMLILKARKGLLPNAQNQSPPPHIHF